MRRARPRSDTGNGEQAGKVAGQHGAQALDQDAGERLTCQVDLSLAIAVLDRQSVTDDLETLEIGLVDLHFQSFGPDIPHRSTPD